MSAVKLSITDDSQLGSLESLLRRELPEVSIARLSGSSEPDALGWEDYLTLTFVGISAVGDLINIVRSYLDSRGEEIGATITAVNVSKRRTKTLTVRNATSSQVKSFTDWLTDD